MTHQVWGKSCVFETFTETFPRPLLPQHCWVPSMTHFYFPSKICCQTMPFLRHDEEILTAQCRAVIVLLSPLAGSHIQEDGMTTYTTLPLLNLPLALNYGTSKREVKNICQSMWLLEHKTLSIGRLSITNASFFWQMIKLAQILDSL